MARAVQRPAAGETSSSITSISLRTQEWKLMGTAHCESPNSWTRSPLWSRRHQTVGRVLLFGHANIKQLDAFSCLVTPTSNSWTRSPAWSRHHQTVVRFIVRGDAAIRLMSAFSWLVSSMRYRLRLCFDL